VNGGNGRICRWDQELSDRKGPADPRAALPRQYPETVIRLGRPKNENESEREKKRNEEKIGDGIQRKGGKRKRLNAFLCRCVRREGKGETRR